MKESSFLKSISDGQRFDDIEQKVLYITKKNSKILEENSGEEPSMSDEEIKDYVQYVIKEIQTGKNILE